MLLVSHRGKARDATKHTMHKDRSAPTEKNDHINRVQLEKPWNREIKV